MTQTKVPASLLRHAAMAFCLCALALGVLRPAGALEEPDDYASAMTELKRLERHQQQLARSYDQTLMRLDRIKVEVADMTERLGDLREYVENGKRRVTRLAVATYKHGPIAMNGAILVSSAENIDDLVRASRYVRAVQESGTDTLRKFEADTASLRTTMQRLDRAKKEQSQMAALLKDQRDAMEDSIGRAESIVDKYRSQMPSPPRYGKLVPPPELLAYGNGRVPRELLAPIGYGAHRLWPPAAAAFRNLVMAASADGVTIGVTDSYRSYEAQVDVAARKGLYKNGGLAATPGTSNHGWGLALDLDLDYRALQWMRTYAPSYGYYEDVPRETWHWQFHWQ